MSFISAVLFYLTTDSQALGILSWVSFVVTTVGLGVALWQIIVTRTAATAARDAALSLNKIVRSREMLLHVNSAISFIDSARTHLSKGGRDTASLCLDLCATSVISARELARNSNEAQLSHQILLTVRVASEDIDSMSEPLSDDIKYQKTIKNLRGSVESLKQMAANLRYSYEQNESAS